MIIRWHGQSFIEIKAKEADIVIDPYGAEVGFKPPKVKADILCITHQHTDHSNKEAVSGNPFIIETTGEYALKGIFIKGVPAFHDNELGRKRGTNIIYVIDSEKMTLCHFGDIGQEELSEKQLEEIGEVDIAFIPVGGVYTVNGIGAAHILHQIEPKIVIPIHYKIDGLKYDLEKVDTFLKEVGQTNPKKLKEVKLSPTSLPEEGPEVILLEKDF
jgi:L-ascorbate metabolism protein UlaG (beta-lactamase superfamily)